MEKNEVNLWVFKLFFRKIKKMVKVIILQISLIYKFSDICSTYLYESHKLIFKIFLKKYP